MASTENGLLADWNGIALLTSEKRPCNRRISGVGEEKKSRGDLPNNEGDGI